MEIESFIKHYDWLIMLLGIINIMYLNQNV